jgi:two-component sensor histidine kinase
LRRLAQRALERRGFSVVTAESADAGLAALANERFDLVAVDNQMPGKSGREMLAEIVRMKEHPPVVFVTGNDDTQVAVEAIHAGALDFVVKTVGDSFFDLLDGRFRQALSRAQLEREKRLAETELRAANARLESLLGEVHHRVANSLQLVSTFVAMQGSQAGHPDTAAALDETLRRIRAIGQVHRSLYNSPDAELVDLDTYLSGLIDALREGLADEGSAIRFEFASVPLKVKPDQAVSIGVLVTELVSNAIKYAYPDGQEGPIRVEVSERPGGAIRVEVCDDGQGFAEGEVKGTGLGMRIVKAMAGGLRSELVRVPRERGTHFALDFGT